MRALRLLLVMGAYLKEIEASLRRRGSKDLAAAVALAVGHASSMSAEFLGESRIALRRVAAHGLELLSEQEEGRLGVLRQLELTLG